MIAFRTPEQREERMKQVPMHRYGTPEEVAQLMAFLLSEQLHHGGGDRHRRRFIRLAPTGWAATRNSAVCALTGHSGRPSQRHYR